MAASPLTKARPSSTRAVNRDKRPLAANAIAYPGGLAACNSSGYFQAASGDPTEVVVGRFYGSGHAKVDNTGGANGDKSAVIEFFRERNLYLVDNDTVAAVAVADRERLCSVLDDHTATAHAAGAGDLGIVYDVTSDGVWVEFPYPASPAESAVPQIQTGTSTLITGTKTITGVKLTANSRIFLTMKDPGAGAITGFGALDAPAGSRNTSTGQFVVNAIDDSKAVIATAVSTFDWMIVG